MLWMSAALRVVLAIPTIILLGYIIRGNGFKFVFTARGFANGMFAGVAFALYIITVLVRFFFATINTAFIPMIPAIILQYLPTGLFEGSLFRGLLMTAMLIKWGHSIKGRLIILLIAGVMFSAGHALNVNITWSHILEASVLGIGLAGIYIYSKNLFASMLLQSLYDIVIYEKATLLIAPSNMALSHVITNFQYVIIYAIIPLFAIILAVKAKPFSKVFLPKKLIGLAGNTDGN